MKRTVLLTCTALLLASSCTLPAAEEKSGPVAPAKAPSCKTYTYKTSAGKPRKMPFFNKEQWRTVTLIAADRFLVKQGLLTGEPTIQAPATGEKLNSKTEK